MLVYHNQQSFKHDKYFNERVEKKSVLTKILNINEEGEMPARYTDFYVNKHLLSDEEDLLQIGQANEIEFEQITHSKNEESMQNVWPKINDRREFKLNGVVLNLAQFQTVIER